MPTSATENGVDALIRSVGEDIKEGKLKNLDALMRAVGKESFMKKSRLMSGLYDHLQEQPGVEIPEFLAQFAQESKRYLDVSDKWNDLYKDGVTGLPQRGGELLKSVWEVLKEMPVVGPLIKNSVAFGNRVYGNLKEYASKIPGLDRVMDSLKRTGIANS